LKFIITGTSGYIGSELCCFLRNKGHAIFEVNRNLDQDVYSVKSLSKIIWSEEPDIIIHLAAMFLVEHESDDIEKLIRSNITIGTNLLEAMRLSSCKKIITAGTSWEYYNSNNFLPVNLYAATKYAFQNIAKYYFEAHDISILNLILYDTYGGFDKRKKLIPYVMKCVYENLSLNMSIGTQKIFLTHIQDICLAFERAATIINSENKKLNLRFSIRGQKSIEIKEIVKIIAGFNHNYSAQISFGAIKERKREIFEPTVRNDILPGWHPSISLLEGLKMTYKNYEK
jgi:nucleoside-diphosphate-sugar epimerase